MAAIAELRLSLAVIERHTIQYHQQAAPTDIRAGIHLLYTERTPAYLRNLGVHHTSRTFRRNPRTIEMV